VAIVPAAGSGKRLGGRIKKPFVILRGKPIIAHTLKALERCAAIDEIIIASEASSVKRFTSLVKKYRFNKVSDIVIGGKTREESVRNVLAALKTPARKETGPSFDIVVVHDGARPLIDGATIAEAIRLADKFGACVVGAPETDTVKLVDSSLFIRKTLDRSRIYRAATPQAFKYDIIKKAYALKGKVRITDDAGLVEHLGNPVKLLVGPYRNIKITTKEDLKIAETLCG
jgi:2-C-methyl-D-erythritol 4-phosphate cytidylyltransferase